MPKLLFILSTEQNLGNTNKKTGFHAEEAALPYLYFKDKGYDITIATIDGQPASYDPSSVDDLKNKDQEMLDKFETHAGTELKSPANLSHLSADDYDGVFLPGGHGTMWDMPTNETLGQLISDFYADEKLVSAVCHGPAGLIPAKKANGEPLVKGLKTNCFTNAEEEKIEFEKIMPFALETALRDQGADFENSGIFASHVAKDGHLVTGQNPTSLTELTKAMNDVLDKQVTQSKAA